jgi:hypothetical protein
MDGIGGRGERDQYKLAWTDRPLFLPIYEQVLEILLT